MGKSHFIRVAAISIALGAPGSTTVIVRKELKALKSNHMVGTGGLPALLNDLIQAKMVKVDNTNNIIRFRNGGPRRNQFNGGSTINLIHLQRGDASLESVQGMEITGALFIDESTHLTAHQINYLKSRVRLGGWRPEPGSTFDGSLPRVVYCTNPGSVSHEWHKNRFTYLEPYVVHASEDEDAFKKMFIPAMIPDNPFIDANYISTLNSLEDPNERRALLFGDWSIASGTLFEHSFKRHHNVIESIELPEGSVIQRSMDFGSSAPSAILYYYTCRESETLKVNGEYKTFPEGTMFFIDEIYSCDPEDYTKGVNVEDTELGRIMKQFEKAAFPKFTVTPGAGDGHMFNVDNNRKSTIDDINHGYFGRKTENKEKLFKCYRKPKGSREEGARMINNMLLAAHKGAKLENASLYITKNCTYTIMLTESLPRDPMRFDAMKGSCDHIFDCMRYAVLTKKREISTARVVLY